MKHFRLFFFTFLLSSQAFAQNGHFFLSHFSPEGMVAKQQSFGIAQDQRGIIYFATRAGLLFFDGREWSSPTNTGAVYTVISNHGGKIYFGGVNGLGQFNVEKEKAEFWSKKITNVFASTVLDNTVYFLNANGIYLFDSVGTQKEQIKPEVPVTNLLELYGKIYASTEDGKLFGIEGNKLVESKMTTAINSEILFATPSAEAYLIGTEDNRLFLFNQNLSLKEITLEDADYIQASRIVNGAWINSTMAVVGTLRGGLIFFNPQSGKTEQIINYSTGLPDNEVFTLMTDKDDNLWAGHSYGFTRVAPYLPFRSMNHYEGLEGNILCSTTFDNTTYVGTSIGLFRLSRENIYQDVIYYESLKKDVQEQVESGKERRGLRNLFRKGTDVQPGNRNITQKVKRTKRILLASGYKYKKIDGIDSKISQFTIWQGKLIASGLSGVYEVNGTKSITISNQPVKYLNLSPANNALIFETVDNTLSLISQSGHNYSVAILETNIHEPIHDFFEGTASEIWLCGLENIYRLSIAGTSVSGMQTIALNNPGFDETVGAVVNGEIVFANSSGVYKIESSQKAVRIDSISSPQNFFSTSSNLWLKNDNGWLSMVKNIPRENLQFLSLLKNVRSITPDNNPAHLWIITSDNQLYRFYGDRIKLSETINPLFLREISLSNKKFHESKAVRLDEDSSKVIFKVVLADYLSASAVSYRYQMEGLDRWSDWSNNNNIPFPFLPSGKYMLNVQARDIFGRITTMQPTYVEVLPPYWRRPWFYAMEASIFAGLVILSFRLSNRFRIVSRLLSLLTIILFIEFIQTVLGATFSTHSSPVIDFIIQVVVALMILPVEGFLRKMMLRSLETKGGLYKLIVPEKKEKKEF